MEIEKSVVTGLEICSKSVVQSSKYDELCQEETIRHESDALTTFEGIPLKKCLLFSTAFGMYK